MTDPEGDLGGIGEPIVPEKGLAALEIIHSVVSTQYIYVQKQTFMKTGGFRPKYANFEVSGQNGAFFRARSLVWLERPAHNRAVRSSNLLGPIDWYLHIEPDSWISLVSDLR